MSNKLTITEVGFRSSSLFLVDDENDVGYAYYPGHVSDECSLQDHEIFTLVTEAKINLLHKKNIRKKKEERLSNMRLVALKAISAINE